MVEIMVPFSSPFEKFFNGPFQMNLAITLQACTDVNLRMLSKRCKPVKRFCMLHLKAFKHSGDRQAPGITNETLGNEGFA
jgi:hypothetical protein